MADLIDKGKMEIIEEGNSFKPVAQTTREANGTSTITIPGAVTAEEKILNKNDLKARSILMMTLPSEHLLTFNKHKDAKSLFEVIKARSSGNEAIKKTQKTLLKQMYETFSASSSESLDSIFNRLQKIVSQLTILGEIITPEELNLKFLRSLPTEWGMHVVVWRNKSDLGSISFDDLYNNFKIVEPEVKRSVTSSSNSGSQNLAFVSGHSSTNDGNTANVHVSTGSTPVSTASTKNSTACLSDATVYAYLATQPNGSQVVHEDLDQIHEDDLDEMDLKWQLALLSMKARKFYQRTGKKIIINGSDTAGYDKKKVECFNCHKLGHFARECRNPKSQENRSRNQDSSRRTVNVEEASPKAMLAIDGLFAPPSVDLSSLGIKKFKEPEFEGYGVKVDKVDEENETVVLESLNVQKPKQVDQPRKVSQNLRTTSTSWNIPKPKKLGIGSQFTPKACFVCESFNHLIKDCDFHNKNMLQKPVLNNVKKVTGQREVRLVWTNAMRVNHQKISNTRRNFAPTAVLTKSGLIPFSTARQSFSRKAAPVSDVRPFNTAIHKPFVNVAKPRTNVFQKAHSSLRRPFYQQTVLKNSNKVNTANVISVNTVKGKRMTNTIGYKGLNAEYILLGMIEAKDSEVCKITRADGTSSFHVDFQALLRRLDRQDLFQLYSLVQERFKHHSLEGHDLDLWGDLRMIFDPNEKDDIWLNQHYWELLRWKLHEYNGVHSLFLDGTLIQINLLVDKKYLLKKEILQKMINLKIEAEEESYMASELINFIKSQIAEQS
ncbi:putative ribonuclease H-like domain-containing protein [Tanacetum coccineum]|uniref:Ribonuclease H-like domain-containing protein n=1 Tax=Tanacetum coccineum TaxID=301880 RepID=A0ABQ5B0R1_9ASTR